MKNLKQKSKIILILFFVNMVFFFLTTSVFAQTASWNYNTQTGTLGTIYSWIDCSGGNEITPLSSGTNDDGRYEVNWPFNFSVYDDSYTAANQISICTNGYIRFDGMANTSYSAASGYNLSSGSVTLGQILCLAIQDGNIGDAQSHIYYQTTGSSPNRVFTIEYQEVEFDYDDNLYADIQVSFYETSNKIVIKFGVDNIVVTSADQGIHSGIATYFNKWQDADNGTNNTWIEYIPVSGETTITAGSGSEPVTISSLTDTQGEAVLNFDFKITDDGAVPANDSDPTKFTDLSINQGAGNDIADWTEAIAGAELSDGTTTETATINAGNLTFPGIASSSSGDFGYIDDNGNKIYTLKIWLKSSLGGTLPIDIDSKNFVFNISSSNFILASGSSMFALGENENSGAANNEVVVTATELQFKTGAPPTAISTSSDFPTTVNAADENGNIDIDNISSVTVSLSTGTGSLSSATGLTQSFTAGTFDWSDIQYDTQETFKIQAVASGLTTVISWDINCVSEFTIGGAGTDSDYPFDNYRTNNRTQLIYKSSEMGGQKTLTYIGFDLTSVTSGINYDLRDLTIKILHTTSSSFPNTAWFDMTGGQVFYSVADYAMPSSTGWFYIDLDTDFPYNGTDNIIVEIDWGKNDGSCASGDNYETRSTLYSGEYMCLNSADWANPHSWGTNAYNRTTIRTDIGFRYYIPEGETTITAGSGTESTTVSSLWDTQGEAVLNFDFTITDDGVVPAIDGDPTKITQIILNKSGTDDFFDWTEAVAGAELSDGTNTETATINSDNLTFTGLSNGIGDFGYIADNRNKTYSLKIWLKSSLGGTLPDDIDGKNFVFQLAETDIAIAIGSSLFKFEQSENSGGTNNEVTVVATCLYFSTQPSGYATLNTNLAQPPVISAIDANNNTDLDFTETITLSSAGGLSLSGNILSAVAGVIEFTNLQFTTGGADAGLNATSATLTECSTSTNIIVCGVYTVPYFDNFDDDLSNSNPYCWSNESFSPTLGPWAVNGVNSYSGSQNLYPGTSPALENFDEWAYTPPIHLIGGIEYTLKFWYRTGSGFDGLDEKLEVYYGNNNVVGSMTNFIYRNENVNLQAYQEAVTTFTPVAEGDYYLGFHCYSIGSRNGVRLDDVWIGEESNFWTGNIDTDWFDAGNWSEGTVPTGTCISGTAENAVIPTTPSGGVFPHITGGVIAECENLTIETGAYVQIEPDAALTVCNDIDNKNSNDGLIIKSDATGSGSLIHSTVDVPATVESHLEGTRYHYVSSPITDASTSIFNTNNFYYWDASAEWGGMGASPPATIDYTPWISYTSGDLVVAKGYAYYFKTTTLEYQGDLNIGDKTYTLQKSATGTIADQGWNFFGNPYPSSIDWDAVVGTNFPDPSTEVESAIYFFDDVNGTGTQANYRYYVPSGGTGGSYGVGTGNATKDIPVGQGFFVKALQNNIAFNILNSDRIHSTQDFYKETFDNLLRLKIVSEDADDQFVVRMLDEATSNFDGGFDARKLFPSDANIPQVFTITGDNINSAINSIPADIPETYIVPMGFICVAGDYTFEVNELTFDAGTKVYISDSYTHIEKELSVGLQYNFSYEGGINTNRFQLLFMQETINADTFSNNDLNIYPNPSKNGLFNIILYSDMQIENILVTDITGKVIKVIDNPNFSENYIQLKLTEFSKGIYFLQLITGNNILNKQLIIK